MKKILLTSLATFGLLASMSAFSAETAICAGGGAGNGVVPASGEAGENYMVTDIKPKCSANVFLEGTDGASGAWYAVGSASVKGKNSFKGHTNGGAVSVSEPCAVAGGCTVGEAQSARDAANTEGASS